MAKFPVQTNDMSGIVQGLNYVLSGPSGLGQNFAGYSTYQLGYLTGNYRTPFSSTILSNLYVSPISLGTCFMLDGRTTQFNFSSVQSSPPFQLGNPVTVSGVTDSFYNGTYSPIGVVECTNSYVILKTSGSYPIEAPSSGGTVSFSNTNTTFSQDSQWISTDCNARVTVTGATDRVFSSGQLDSVFQYTGSGDLQVYVAINRYTGFLNSDPTNPDYLFNYDQTVAQKVYSFTGLTGPGTLTELDTVFATVLDQPVPDYYWYILEVQFVSTTVQVTQADLGFRSLSSQVVKQ